MAKKKARRKQAAAPTGNVTRQSKHVQLSVRDFKIPLVRDVLVLGKESPIGLQAMHRALSLMGGRTFDKVECDDDVIGAILVRREILNRLPAEELQQVVKDAIKPVMDSHELLIVDVDAELVMEVKR